VEDSKTLTVVEEPVIVMSSTPSRTPYLFINDTVTYTWTSSNTDSCEGGSTEATTDNDLLIGTQPLNGSITLPMPSDGLQSMTLKCTGSTGATTSKTVSYRVYDAVAPASVSIT